MTADELSDVAASGHWSCPNCQEQAHQGCPPSRTLGGGGGALEATPSAGTAPRAGPAARLNRTALVEAGAEAEGSFDEEREEEEEEDDDIPNFDL